MRLSSVVCFLTLAAIPSSAQYFPPGVFDRTPQKDESIANEYSRFLKALHEPSLWELSREKPEAEVYRFFWLRSSHRPIAVRVVVRKSGSGWINSHMTSGDGSRPGRIVRYSVSWLTKNKTQTFLATIQGAGFWNLPTELEKPESIAQLDGAEWIVEGVKNGQYHIIGRRSPGPPDAVRTIGLLALKLSRFHLHSDQIY